MTGAGAVTALVLLEWTVGWVAGAAWTQSWAVVKRGHFRITAWGSLILGVLAILAAHSTLDDVDASSLQWRLALAVLVGIVLYVTVQYSNTDVPGTVVGYGVGVLGVFLLSSVATLLAGWPGITAAVQLLSGAVLLGAVTNGMMLGHWYLNQPGLKPWALERLTNLALVASLAAVVVGLLTVTRLTSATTEGAAFGLEGFGESFGPFFYLVWLSLLVFTGGVVWMARRCVQIKSIQSATGLYYVAILTAGVGEFLVRYLMVNAT
jgi:hypothetical protein